MNKLQEEWPGPLWPYVAVVSAFLDRRLTADELEVIYLSMFKHDDREWPSEVFEPLNEIFLDLDRGGLRVRPAIVPRSLPRMSCTNASR